MAGNSSSPRSSIWYSRCTPVVVSSVTPLMAAAMRVHFCGSSRSVFWSRPSTMANSGFEAEPRVGHLTELLVLGALVDEEGRVAAVVEDHVRSVGSAGHESICSVHHQYSSSVSPFQA